MKNSRRSDPASSDSDLLSSPGIFRAFGAVVVALLLLAAPTARAGLTLELHFYRNNQGGNYSFYTPLYTNATPPAAPLGTYLIISPHEPTNGSVRGFQLTTNGMQDLYSADSEYGYGDFDSAIYQITNGAWTLLFTNATTTNTFNFTVSSSPSLTSNMLPASSAVFPIQGQSLLTNETSFSWQGPTSWPAGAFVQVFNPDNYYNQASLPSSQTNWTVDSMLPTDENYSLFVRNLYTNSLFAVSTPTDTVSSLPFGGWDSFNVLETGFNLNFMVVANHGTPSHGHTLIADYTFEDNNLSVHDFSGNGYDTSYAWFTVPPTIVTNDAAAGTYAGGLGGSGWFTPPSRLAPLFEGSFSVSLWLKTTNVFGADTGDLYSSAGIVSDLGDTYDQSAAPMIQSGHKLAFFTGGDLSNLLRSRADITTGQYVHVVATRDQRTGEKRLYVNGVLDASLFSSTNVLYSCSNGDLTIGYNNGQVFSGQVDEVQFYSGVLSSNEVASLHGNPGTAAPDVLELDMPAARFDFEDTNNAGIDSTFHHNDADCGGSSGTTNDVPSTNAIVGNYARQFFGDTHYCFSPSVTGISNALSHDFSVTAWVNTTNSVNADFANAYFGMPILFSYSSNTNGTTAFSITGSKAAFTVSNPSGTDTIIHSITSVNDGRYHFLAVTRSQSDGVMKLYVDGVLEASGTCNTLPIETTGTVSLGGGYYEYAGLLDDVRIYASALSADNVSTLAANNGLTFANVLGTTNIVWLTSGDSPWTIETTNTYNGAQAALQSGSITNLQTSTLSATITGPGLLNFVWQNPTMNNLDLEFDLDNNYEADIGSFTDWSPAGPFLIGPGQHTLTWTAYANFDSDPNEAAFLAQVTFTPAYLVAHFDFEDTNAPYPLDVSSNGNDMTWGFGFNGGGTAKDTNAVAGKGSLRFFRDAVTSFSGGFMGWKPSTPPGLLQTLAGSFSISLWIKTTNHTGTVGDVASDGVPIVSADVLGDALDSTPVALTGGAVAFGTGGTPGDDTLTSSNIISDNNWHHVVVTRDQDTGQKRIFIDGVEDSSSPGAGVAGLLNAPNLLSIGTRLDANHSDPSTSPIYAAGFDGLIDDLQIYARPLMSNDVAFLFAHPGKELGSAIQSLIPDSVQLLLEIQRNQIYTGNGQDYVVFPHFISINPAPITHHEIISPNHEFFARSDTGASSSDFNSLSAVINECTNGLWWLILNAGDPSEQDLHFSVSVSGLDTNVLAPVIIYAPTNGSANITRAPSFQWSGPANFESVEVIESSPTLANFDVILPPATTNWTAPQQLNYGTNEVGLRYVSNNFPLVTFTTPMDTNTLVPLSNWVATVTLKSSGVSDFVVGAPAPLPVHLGSIQRNATNFQFSFATLAGRPHILQGSTNLFSWTDITNFIGDGTVQQFLIGRTNKQRFFRVITQ